MTPFQALIILLIVIVIVWWALRRSASQSPKEAPTGHAHEAHAEHVEHPVIVHSEVAAEAPVRLAEVVLEPEPVVEVVEEPAPVVEVKPDDLIIIEGIGPKISSVLIAHGVKTFAQLAGMQPEAIKAILTAEDERLGRIADPTTWPQQAALAAQGDLEGLQKLQDSLKGGRV